MRTGKTSELGLARFNDYRDDIFRCRYCHETCMHYKDGITLKFNPDNPTIRRIPIMNGLPPPKPIIFKERVSMVFFEYDEIDVVDSAFVLID